MKPEMEEVGRDLISMSLLVRDGEGDAEAREADEVVEAIAMGACGVSPELESQTDRETQRNREKLYETLTLQRETDRQTVSDE